MTTPLAAWPADFAGVHSPVAACQGGNTPDKPAVCWLDEDHDLPQPLVVEAFDEVLLHGQMTAIRGILGMTDYRLGTLSGIRCIAKATGMWNGAEMALFEECEAIIGAWHDVAKDIAARRDLQRAELMAQAEECPS